MDRLAHLLAAQRDLGGQPREEVASADWGGELVGGGTLLPGLAELISRRTGMAVTLADSPLTCVAVGSGQALEHFDQLAARLPFRR